MGILQVRILEWVALPSSRGSSLPKDQTRISYICTVRHVLYHLGSPGTNKYYLIPLIQRWASQVALVVKNPLANAGDITDAVSTSGLGRSPGGGHGNPLQYSCLENSMDRGAWWLTAHRVAMSQTQLKQLSAHTYRETAKVKSRVRKYIGRRQGPGGGGSGGRGMGSWCLMRTEFQFRKVKNQGDGWWWELHNRVNVLSATELYS